jgi:CubicO group peptidase (beta-lactamase class C family)
VTERGNSQGLSGDPEQDGAPDAGVVLMEGVRDGRVPGAVAAIGRGPDTTAIWVAGHADTTPGAERLMRPVTLFDLASLTKVVGTATAVLALAGQGGLGLDDRAGRYLPHFGALGAVTVRQLLAHTSGLPDTRKFYEWCASPDELLRDLHTTPLEAPPGTQVTYSDLGFMALGEIVAAVAGEPLDAAVARLVTAPLDMPQTRYYLRHYNDYNTEYSTGAGADADADAGAGNVRGTAEARVAGRYVQEGRRRGRGGAGFAGMGPVDDSRAPGAGGFAATERKPDGTAWTGIVHDENARLMGGVAGHAGLFAPVADLAAFATWWVGEDDVAVPARLRREAERLQTAGLDGCRGLGWVRQGDRYDILRGTWPPGSVSHTGFTGTSLAIDPESRTWAVLLTNAVHFGRDADRIRTLRREFHAALAPGSPT